jgi:potassium-transporting ATPase KdpC subunit
MKNFFSETRAAGMAVLVLAAACCGLYPLIVFVVGQALFPHQANGSLILDQNGILRGSTLLGQNFTGAAYFHPRPSAAGNGYDAASSSGSNLGPTSKKLHDAIQERVAGFRLENGLQANESVPADAVTASASGLDPLISPRNAELQAGRVAKARGLPPEQLQELIRKHTAGRDLGILGEPGVNVLMLNMALDSLRTRP